MSVKGVPQITAHASIKDYTLITFTPDLEKFGMTVLDSDIRALFAKRAYDMAGCIPRVSVWLNGEKIKVKGFKQYIGLYVKDDKEVVYGKVGSRWEVGITASEGQFNQVR